MQIRIMLVGHAGNDWRLYRQPQWIGEVRRLPGRASLPRRAYDIEESAYNTCRSAWTDSGPGASEAKARAELARHGAVEVPLR